MRLNQVTLTVSDMTKACDFYLSLGFTQIVSTVNSGNHYARFACPEGEASFSLSLNQSSANFDDIVENINTSVIYFEHRALDEWVNKLVGKGIKFSQLPVDESYLWREAILFDPSGNKIKLYWAGENRLNPPWRVDIKAAL
ncbi:VOC family protein [Shewanella olleyana]|uniref:VOC family protein n=1 Tax=Shewanella olleyana TaxID=135626 RepID=UPI0020105AF1|nr:VOC family protein [Shewanella olleyana]MCL1067938.1 VOC family protein [Shewanella olleyana]